MPTGVAPCELVSPFDPLVAPHAALLRKQHHTMSTKGVAHVTLNGGQTAGELYPLWEWVRYGDGARDGRPEPRFETEPQETRLRESEWGGPREAPTLETEPAFKTERSRSSILNVGSGLPSPRLPETEREGAGGPSLKTGPTFKTEIREPERVEGRDGGETRGGETEEERMDRQVAEVMLGRPRQHTHVREVGKGETPEQRVGRLVAQAMTGRAESQTRIRENNGQERRSETREDKVERMKKQLAEIMMNRPRPHVCSPHT